MLMLFIDLGMLIPAKTVHLRYKRHNYSCITLLEVFMVGGNYIQEVDGLFN